MRKLLPMCALASIILASQATLAAETADLPVVKPQVKTIAAFKNGLGFVFKSGKTELKEGWVRLDEIPPASLGTLWIGTASAANTQGRVDEVIAYKGAIKTEVEAIDFIELLTANVGKKLTLAYRSGELSETKQITGKVMSVSQDRRPDPVNPLLVNNSSRGYDSVARGFIVLIKTDAGGILAINKADVRSIELPVDAPLKHVIEKQVNLAKLRVSGNPASAEVTMAYLEKGINWSPGYLINIKDEKTADITLEAVLANDVEDLNDVDVSFVVGYPNFLYANVFTPMLLQQSVANFTQSITNAQSNGSSAGYGGLSNVMRQSISYNTSTDADWQPSGAYNAGQPMAGESNEDLYLYHQPHVTMKKGDRARYTIFTSKVPYEHVYLWSVPDSMNVDEWGNRISSSNTKDTTSDQVWHAIKLQNDTGRPWTTAPAFVVNGSMPAAQPVLDYTPPTGKTTLKMTIATDVRADQTQTEVSRKQVQVGSRNYDEILVDGVLKIKNFKKNAVKMNVKKSVSGEVISSADGKALKVAKKLSSINPESEIAWEFDLPSGGEKSLTYQYKLLIYR